MILLGEPTPGVNSSDCLNDVFTEKVAQGRTLASAFNRILVLLKLLFGIKPS